MNFPGYEVIRKLSEGGFGVVHLARRRSDQRHVAIKVLHRDTDTAMVRFYREAKIMHANIYNPHVVELIESRFDMQPPFIVMEFCDGGPLANWIGKNVPWRQIAYALSQAASGLTGIHENGGFHRDIKPHNLLLAKDLSGAPIVRVGDFGLARDPAITSSGPYTNQAAGTPGYMAPELMRGGEMTAAADVYSLGITCIELLTGRRDAGALFQLVRVPRQFTELLSQMVHEDPAQRPFIDHVQRTLVTIAQPSPPVPPPTPAPAPRNSSGGWVLLGLAAAAIAMGAATMNTKDKNGRFHGPDGKFRGGRWE